MRTPKTSKREAFVAMKFDGNSWNDARFLAISEVLKEAGFEPVRADQIQSSGSVVDEVCSHFRNAPLVVIDTTGDSPSVSYEIGYCHGIERDPAKTILIREGDGKDIPFNYRHFRHRCYKTKGHLKRLLREYLSLSTPLLDEQYGYVFVFDVPKGATGYAIAVQKAFLETIAYFDFTGRCEFFENDGHISGAHLYFIALGLKFPRIKKPVPTYAWWMKFCERVRTVVEKAVPLKMCEMLSEMARMGAIRHDKELCGVYEFHDGKRHRFIQAEEIQRGADVSIR